MTSTDLAHRERDLFAPLEEAAHLPTGAVTFVGLELTNPDMTIEDWTEIGRNLGHAHRWVAWALGDWINFGEALYGQDAYDATEGVTADRYDVAGRVTGLAASTLMNYASVCTRVARARRRVELPFTVHEAVAALEPEEQVEWLQRAVDEAMSREDLRAAIREAKNPDALGAGDEAPSGGGPERLSRAEQIEAAANQVFQQGQPTGRASHEVPDSAWAQLSAALGHE